MIAANQYCLTWEHFEDINPNKRDAFENLCRSLFYRTLVADNSILHSNPNHPGVEVAPVLSKDGKSWISFQAKFFDGEIGYSQIKSSMETTINKYCGKLDIVYLYCNKDITTTSQPYERIEKLVNDAGIKIIPITGQSILDDAMDYPNVLARYFGLDFLDEEWFDANLSASLSILGKRYNSLFDVDTSVKKKMSIFLKEQEGIDLINEKKREILDELKELRWRCDGEYKDIIKKFTLDIERIQDISQEDYMPALDWADAFLDENRCILNDLNKIEKEKSEKLDSEKVGSEKYNAIRNELYVIGRLKCISEKLRLSEVERRMITNRVMVLSGEMGSGKSQLLATSAKRLMDDGRMSLLILGQTLISDDSVDAQIISGLEGINPNETLESVIAVLDECAYLSKKYSVVFIDAINETRNKEIWKNGINRLLRMFEKYNNVLLVISLRNGFETLTFSEEVLENIKKGKIASLVHYGLDKETPKGVFDFISHYGIPVSPEYYLQYEMSNPLFLMWFCQNYNGEDQEIELLIKRVIKKADEEASKEAGSNEPLGMLMDLLWEFVEASVDDTVTRKIILGFKTWELYGVTNKIAYLKAVERAGVLTTYVRKGDEIYYVGYNLLEEYIHASWIVNRFGDEKEIKDYCINSLLAIDSDGNITRYENKSIFIMTSVLYANKFGELFFDVIEKIKDSWDREQITDEYIRTFTWRKTNLSLDQFVEAINKYKVSVDVVWQIFIENATKEKSVFNSFGLSELLGKYELNKRDYLWTTSINELTEDDRIVSLAYYLESGAEFSGLSDNKAYLLLVLFSWMLSSSNRVLRDRISKSMIEVLKDKFNLCIMLFERFKDVNDPYIIQRLLGIIFGAIMKRTDAFAEEYESLAITIYENIFLQEKVYPDILLRDYARLIIERFIYEFPRKADMIQIDRARPPYKSEEIPTVEPVDYDNKKYHDSGLWRLLFSMKFDLKVNGVGMYGDFGRYIFQSALNHFVGVDEQNIYYYALDYILNEIGYSNDLFGEYDTNHADFDRHHVRRIERIGKKYEWIAFYNILARLSDSNNVTEWSWNDKQGKPYSGAWNPYVRDFDPTLNQRYIFDNAIFPILIHEDDNESAFLDMNCSDEDIERWIIEDDAIYSEFPDKLIITDADGTEWVSMYRYKEKQKKVMGEDEFPMSFSKGEQHIWVMLSLHITNEENHNVTLEDLQTSNYAKQSSNMRDCYSIYNREYAWSPGYISEFEDNEDEADENIARTSVVNFSWGKEYDASQDEGTSLLMPYGDIIRAMNLYQKEVDGAFYCDDELVAFDTKIIGSERGELLIRRDVLNEYLKKKKLKAFWVVEGEKQYFCGMHNQKWQRREGYFIYDTKKINGEILIVPNI